MLEQMGIANASEIVTARLAAQEAFLTATKSNSSIASNNLTDATWDEINAVLAEGNASEVAKSYLAKLALSKLDITNNPINTEDDINAIIAIANAAGTSSEYVGSLKQVLQNLKEAQNSTKMVSGVTSGVSGVLANALAKGKETSIENELKDILSQIQVAQLNPADFYANYTGGSSTQSAKDKSNSSSKETKETFDFIETKIERLTTSYDKLKSKAENTFSTMTARANNYDKAIKKNTELINLQQQAYNQYKAQRDSVGLDEYWASQVRNGSLNIETVTDENLKNQIQEYQEWYNLCHVA